MNTRKNKTFRLSALGLLLVLLAICALPAWAVLVTPPPALAQIPIYTPTPGPDGRIIYVVRANDTLMGISLIMGVSIEKLRELNELTGDTIFEGQQLLLGMGGPAEVVVTAGPPPTATPILPTPSPQPGVGMLCVILFDDLNGNSIREDGEPSLPNGAISFGNRSGTISQALDTGAGDEHTCFEALPEGNYSLTAALPNGYNPTTKTEYELLLKDGDSTYVNFGAQANTQTELQQNLVPEGDDRSPLLGIIGGIFLALAVGVGIYAVRVMRR